MGYNTIPGESGFGVNSDSKHINSHLPRNHRSYNKNVNLQNEQFLRSASVRLPRKADDNGMRDNEQKREESMKRLLEWKQRMLQSPLTRKGVPISIAMDAKTPLSVKTANITQGIQRSRSATNANNAGYNSYSSDDEGELISLFFFFSLSLQFVSFNCMLNVLLLTKITIIFFINF